MIKTHSKLARQNNSGMIRIMIALADLTEMEKDLESLGKFTYRNMTKFNRNIYKMEI